jgi:hypothetical protein
MILFGSRFELRLSWTEIEARASVFAQEWVGTTSEQSEKQTFWNEFFEILGVNRRRVGGYFEQAVKLRSNKYGFIDLFVPGKLLVEHKSAGRNLLNAKSQGFDYLIGLRDDDLPEYIVASDFSSFEMHNLETGETSHFNLEDLPRHIRKFGFLIEEKPEIYSDAAPVTRRAAEKIAEIHDVLLESGFAGHKLEIFLTRLIFCLFAEDSGIFEPKQFRDYLRDRTSSDGSDLGPKLGQLFQVLDTPEAERQKTLEEELAAFPYVNGELFREPLPIPAMDSGLRSLVIESSTPDWRKVSPEIFGAMFQAILDPELRKVFGAHYTSEENILKAIRPLFLDELYFKLDSARKSKRPLEALTSLHDEISKLTFLDPACGSGNFLIVSYRELRRLEHRILLEQFRGQSAILSLDDLIKVSIDQFFGFEILESSSLIARVSMWLVDHQMNLEASEKFGRTFVRLPLPSNSTIKHLNAARCDWNSEIDPEKLSYIIGNPPFSGSRKMKPEQKEDMRLASFGFKKYKSLDYVCIWFFKAAHLVSANPKVQVAFVSTNSVTQGLISSLTWSAEIMRDMKIRFAHKSFRWSNKAKGIAQVHCVIIGFGIQQSNVRTLFEYEGEEGDPIPRSVKDINPYLLPCDLPPISPSQVPASGIPEMDFGNMPDPAELLVYEKEVCSAMIASEPKLSEFFRPAYGATEALQGMPRFALWLEELTPSQQREIETLDRIVIAIRAMRLKGSRPENASLGGAFAQITQRPNAPFLLIPRVFVAGLSYVPCSYFDAGVVSLDSALVVENAPKWLFSLIASSVHLNWLDTVGGKMKSDYRYSKELVYNTFPIPSNLDETSKNLLEGHADRILEARSHFPDSSLADLYNKSSIPRGLHQAHQKLDKFVLGLYELDGNLSEEDISIRLLSLYKSKKT